MERSLVNAIEYGKRKADKECYSFLELILDAGYNYYLRDDELEILLTKLVEYCKKNLLYSDKDFEFCTIDRVLKNY